MSGAGASKNSQAKHMNEVTESLETGGSVVASIATVTTHTMQDLAAKVKMSMLLELQLDFQLDSFDLLLLCCTAESAGDGSAKKVGKKRGSKKVKKVLLAEDGKPATKRDEKLGFFDWDDMDKAIAFF